MTSLKLYSAEICPFAQRARIHLQEKQLAYEEIEIDLGNKPEWFFEVSPFGKVPVLQHDEKIIYESSVINEYLEDAFPEPSLFSRESYTRALMRIWMSYCNSTLIPKFYNLMREGRSSEAEQNLMDVLHYIEKEGLAKLSDKGPYFFGERLTIVDITFFPFMSRFPVVQKFRGVTIPSSCSRILDWMSAMQQLESVQNTSREDEYYIQAYADKFDLSIPKSQ